MHRIPANHFKKTVSEIKRHILDKPEEAFFHDGSIMRGITVLLGAFWCSAENEKIFDADFQSGNQASLWLILMLQLSNKRPCEVELQLTSESQSLFYHKGIPENGFFKECTTEKFQHEERKYIECEIRVPLNSRTILSEGSRIKFEIEIDRYFWVGPKKESYRILPISGEIALPKCKQSDFHKLVVSNAVL